MTSSIISISSEKKSDKRMRQAEESGRGKKKKKGRNRTGLPKAGVVAEDAGILVL